MKNNIVQLNDHQRQAVEANIGHYLILAGAGSGKTRVLVHRITYLIEHYNCSPYAILSVTFTNKAAREMRERIAQQTQAPVQGMWVGTFHGLSHRLLRSHWQEADLQENFQILDQGDQFRMIKRIMQSLEMDDKRFVPKQVQWFINRQKEKGFRSGSVPNQNDFYTATLTRVYAEYERLCQHSGLVDFGEILLRAVLLLEENKDIAQYYQQRFQHILVDEFQDTNTIQYRWLKVLSGGGAALMAVGDDDQSIYSWRGANIENINHFENDYPKVQTIRLEQNYRSTQTILTAANAVISHNNNRMGKELWTDGDSGEKIEVYEAFNENDEAYYICNQIRHMHRRGIDYQNMAILYRSNAQSRILEEQLIREQMPYRIYGGQKFFDRAEIKDAIAYCRLIANPNDDAAFDRIINVPPRGIGQQTVFELRRIANEQSITIYQAMLHAIEHTLLSSRATKALINFKQLMENLAEYKNQHDLDVVADACIKQSGLLQHYQKDKSEKGLSRVDNLEELISAMAQFDKDEQLAEDNMGQLDAYLAHIALETGESQADEHSDSVNLMTLHAAKGLEFDVVLMCGVEEGLFPHKMSMDSAGGLEEERRLCYVGMTRARQQLFMTYATWRRMYASEKRCASRFIREIPSDLKHTEKPMQSQPSAREPIIQSTHGQHASLSPDMGGLCIGQSVQHARFGMGTIIQCEGSGPSARIAVQFENNGLKWLVAKYAKLQTGTVTKK